jgi:hypothetical protein
MPANDRRFLGWAGSLQQAIAPRNDVCRALYFAARWESAQGERRGWRERKQMNIY